VINIQHLYLPHYSNMYVAVVTVGDFETEVKVRGKMAKSVFTDAWGNSVAAVAAAAVVFCC